MTTLTLADETIGLRASLQLHKSKPHYFTDENGVGHEGYPKCSECEQWWGEAGCDAHRASVVLDDLARQYIADSELIEALEGRAL